MRLKKYNISYSHKVISLIQTDLNPRPSPRSVDEYYEDLAEELGEILQQETTSEIPISVISQCQRLVETRQFVEQLLAKKVEWSFARLVFIFDSDK